MPWGGMEGVCRVVIAVKNPMDFEFSLLTKWRHHCFEWEASWVKVDHFTKVTMTCEAGHYDVKNHLMVAFPSDEFWDR